MDNSENINLMEEPPSPDLAPFYENGRFSIERYASYQTDIRVRAPEICRGVEARGWSDESVWEAIGQAVGRWAKLALLKDLWEAHDRYVQRLLAQGVTEGIVWPAFREMARRINRENSVGSPLWFLARYLPEKERRSSSEAMNRILSSSLDYSRRSNDRLSSQPAAPAVAAGEEPPADSLVELEFRRIVKSLPLREGVRKMLAECTRKKQFVEICRLIIKRKQLTYNEMIRKENILPLMAMTQLTVSYDYIQRQVSRLCVDLDEA